MPLSRRYAVSLGSATFLFLIACGGKLSLSGGEEPVAQKTPVPVQNLSDVPNTNQLQVAPMPRLSTPVPVEVTPSPRAVTPTPTESDIEVAPAPRPVQNH